MSDLDSSSDTASDRSLRQRKSFHFLAKNQSVCNPQRVIEKTSLSNSATGPSMQSAISSTQSDLSNPIPELFVDKSLSNSNVGITKDKRIISGFIVSLKMVSLTHFSLTFLLLKTLI